MQLATVAAVSGAILATVAVIGLGAAGIRWFFKRGADEREMTIAVKDNTEATRELTSLFNEFRVAVTDRFHIADMRLADHDSRINRLEAHDFHSPDRNASPQS